MRRYILNRVLQLIPVLLGISIVVFVIIQLTPGDPAVALLGVQATPDELARVRHAMGLDRPVAVQYLIWFGNVVRGDFGISYSSKKPVLQLLLQRIPTTFELAFLALVVSVAIGIPTGVVSATRQYSGFDMAATSLALFGISMPNFWLGIMLILIFALYLGWFPASGFAPLSQGLGKNLAHLVLPALTLGLNLGGGLTRFTRTSMLEVLGQDYIRTARAKGLAERVTIYRHALKNALIPVVTVIGLQSGFLLGGAIITEQVFALPGLGWLAVTAVNQRDYTVVQGVVLLVATIFVVTNLAVDVLYTYLNPRIHFEAPE